MNRQQKLEHIVELHQAGRLDEAIRGYHEILTANPDQVDALHLLGVALEQAGHPAQAKPLVEHAIEREPAIAAYRCSLGNIHMALGDLKAARNAYLDALRLDARLADALSNLGVLAQQDEDWETAAEYFQRALAVTPAFLPARFNLAIVDWLSGRQDESAPVLQDLLSRAPEYGVQVVGLAKRTLALKDVRGLERLIAMLQTVPIPHADRDALAGGLASLHGENDKAERLYRDALTASPGNLGALRNLSQILMQRQAYADAVPLLERMLALKPGEIPVVTALAAALSKVGIYDRAIPLLQQVLQHKPDSKGAWADLAKCYSKLDRLDDACASLARLIELDPERAGNYAAMGGFEARRGNLTAGENFCLEGIRRDPQCGEAIGNLGNIRGVQRRFDEALALYREHVALRPDDGGAQFNLCLTYLRLGRYEEGWKLFDWRWKSGTWTSSDAGQRGLPRWRGAMPVGGRILIWPEQGIGDQILFGSLLPDLVAKGPDIVLATDRRLVPLFARSMPGIAVRSNDDSFDVDALGLTMQCPIGDLGPICRPDAASFGGQPHAFLKADPDRVAQLRTRYRSLGRKRLVGISWNSGNPFTGRYKSVSLNDMAPLLQDADTAFVSLQYGKAAADIETARLPEGALLHRDVDIDPLLDLDAQAAQIAALDMVVTVSTSAAHLAAALGVPTLILLPEDWGQLWYWGYEGERTPWYSSVRLCRGEAGERANDIVLRARPVFHAMLEQVQAGRE